MVRRTFLKSIIFLLLPCFRSLHYYLFEKIKQSSVWIKNNKTSTILLFFVYFTGIEIYKNMCNKL